MKILVLPRDTNPYQERLYSAMAARAHYLGDSTGSRTLNLLMLPLELVWRRLSGYRLIHIHWVFGFSLPVLSRFVGARKLMRYWFWFTLVTCQVLGIRVVWIAHNVLPHEQVFDDDVAGRRMLMNAADGVLVHASSVLDDLSAIAPLPAHLVVARHPAYEAPQSVGERPRSAQCRVLFFGLVLPYKGVPALLRAAQICESPFALTVAGRCTDADLRREIEYLAAGLEREVELKLERLSDVELTAAIQAADIVVLPFARITTSSSVLHAMSLGRPVMIPDLPALSDFPVETVLRYRASEDPALAIAEALDFAVAHRARLDEMGRRAREWAHSYGWNDLANDVLKLSHECLQQV